MFAFRVGDLFEEAAAVEAEPRSPCILWKGNIDKDGYGRLAHPVTKKYVFAHRYFYEEAHGPIAPGLVVRHKIYDCRACVNPLHLAIGIWSALGAERRIGAGRLPGAGR